MLSTQMHRVFLQNKVLNEQNVNSAQVCGYMLHSNLFLAIVSFVLSDSFLGINSNLSLTLPQNKGTFHWALYTGI